jgi:Tc5 transposase DNA-binding domain
MPIREKSLSKTANSILRTRQNREGPPHTVSKMWASRWLKRHPKYKKKALKPLAAARKNAHDPDGIEKWFQKLRTVREQYGVLNEDIHNMDEIGFRIGVGRSHKVIIRSTDIRQYL